jgi:protein-tyrosine phosphatase
MEKHHKQKITERFRGLLNGKRIVILNITDEYEYMDEELLIC